LIDGRIRHKDNKEKMDEFALQSSKFNFNVTVCKNHDFNIIALGKLTIG